MPHHHLCATDSDDVTKEIAGLLRTSACAKLQALSARPDLGPLLLAFSRRVTGTDDLTSLDEAELDRLADVLVRWLDSEEAAARPRLVSLPV